MRNIYEKNLVVACNIGKSSNGKNIIKKMRYGNINLSATPEKLHTVGKAISVVVKGELDGVFREDKYNHSEAAQ